MQFAYSKMSKTGFIFNAGFKSSIFNKSVKLYVKSHVQGLRGGPDGAHGAINRQSGCGELLIC